MTLGLVTLLATAGLEVQWNAPATCEQPDLSLLASANGRAQITITSPTPATWILDLTFLEPFQATRHLELGSCGDARRAARALLLLGLKGAEAFQTQPPPSPPPLTETEAAPGPAPVAPSFRFSFRAGALANALTVPAVTPRFLLAATVGVDRFQLELSARAGLPASYAGGPIDGAAVSIWPTIGAEVAGCYVISPTTVVRPAVCGTVLVEWWQLRGSGVSDPLAGSAALLGAGGLAEVAIGLGERFELVPFLSARGHLRRPSARFDGVAALEASPLGIEAGATFGIRTK